MGAPLAGKVTWPFLRASCWNLRFIFWPRHQNSKRENNTCKFIFPAIKKALPEGSAKKLHPIKHTTKTHYIKLLQINCDKPVHRG